MRNVTFTEFSLSLTQSPSLAKRLWHDLLAYKGGKVQLFAMVLCPTGVEDSPAFRRFNAGNFRSLRRAL